MTIVAVIIVIGVYFVFDTKLLLTTSISSIEDGTYIDTQSASDLAEVSANTTDTTNTDLAVVEDTTLETR